MFSSDYMIDITSNLSGGSDKHNKGYFATSSDLTTAYPTAEAGDYAIVGSTDTVWVWEETTSSWVDTDTKAQRKWAPSSVRWCHQPGSWRSCGTCPPG